MDYPEYYFVKISDTMNRNQETSQLDTLLITVTEKRDGVVIFSGINYHNSEVKSMPHTCFSFAACHLGCTIRLLVLLCMAFIYYHAHHIYCNLSYILDQQILFHSTLLCMASKIGHQFNFLI